MKFRSIAIVATVIFFAAVTSPAFAMLHTRLGRFVQRDPLGYVDGMNAYTNYAALTGTVDPDGQFSRRFVKNWRARKTQAQGEIAVFMSNFAKQASATPPLAPASQVSIYWYPPENMQCCDEVKWIQAERTDHIKWGYDEKNAMRPDNGRFGYLNQTPWTPGSRYAFLDDNPGGDVGWTYYISQTFISAVVCSAGPEEGYMYGSVAWGHEFDDFPTSPAYRYNGLRTASNSSASVTVTGTLNNGPQGEIPSLQFPRAQVLSPGTYIHSLFDNLVR